MLFFQILSIVLFKKKKQNPQSTSMYEFGFVVYILPRCSRVETGIEVTCDWVVFTRISQSMKR
jgi:hypothetical protein